MLDKKTEEVLRFIHSKHQAFSAKGYSVYLTSDKLGIEYPELRSICEHLRNIGYIECTFSKTVNQITTSITREGIRYLEEKDAQQKAEQQVKKERRNKIIHDWAIAIFSFIGGIITAKFDVIYSWFMSL